MLALFRVDTGLNIGLGHIQRCLTIAEYLLSSGYEILFISRTSDVLFKINDINSQFDHRYIDRTHHQFSLEYIWPKGEQLYDAKWINNELRNRSIDTMIVDHYGLSYHFEEAVNCKHVLAIDDLYNRKHFAHIIVNQAATSVSNYDGLLRNKNCKQLLGPKYAIIGKEIKKEAMSSSSIDNKNWVLYFGSGQTGAYILAVVKKILSLDFKRCTIILNQGDPSFERVKEFSKTDHRIKVFSYIKNFAKLLTQTTLFIGANGATSWERAFLGVPSLTFTLAENQKNIEKTLDSSNSAIILGKFNSENLDKMYSTLQDLLNNPGKLTVLSQNSKCLCDGKGVKRIAKEISYLQNDFQGQQ